MTGGRRCREGRNFTLPAGGCATRARSCVASNRHPPSPSFRQVSWDPREEKTPPCGLGKPAGSAASSACSFGVSSTKSTLRVLATAPRGASWKLTARDPPPSPRSQGCGDSRPGQGGAVGRRGGGAPSVQVTRPPCRSLAGRDRLVGTRSGGRRRVRAGVCIAGGVPLSSGA